MCECIYTRVCIGGVGVQATYSAEVSVPAPLVALMSALQDGEPIAGSPGQLVYRFRQPVLPALRGLGGCACV